MKKGWKEKLKVWWKKECYDSVCPNYEDVEKEFSELIMEASYWQPCEGCVNGHPSFWKTITESEEWMLWHRELSRRNSLLRANELPDSVPIYDIDESQECNVISPKHFHDFLAFCVNLKTQKLLDQIKKLST